VAVVAVMAAKNLHFYLNQDLQIQVGELVDGT
jgi:hypothetical protein